MCKPGYYFPNVTAREKYFNGSVIEAEAADQKASYYSNPDSFQCLKCQPGCKTCKDSSPCIVTMDWPLRKALMGLTAVSIVGAIGIMAFVIHFRELKVRKFAVCWRVVSFGSNSLGNLDRFSQICACVERDRRVLLKNLSTNCRAQRKLVSYFAIS